MDNIRLILGDGIEEMKKIPNKFIDLVLTDPPYNAKNIGPNKREYSQGIMCLPEREYKDFCESWFKEAIRISKAVVFTPGIANTHNYPQPFWQICWHKPASVSFNRMGGFNAWEPIFTYGEVTKAKIGQDYIKVNTLNFNKGPEREHPCPKVKELWGWLIRHFSKEGDIILDPFVGSGTTAVVCKEQKRNCIAIDINPNYIKISQRRINNTVELML
jgi:DNA modification methylase